ncbi:MAG: hypothetical protein Kow00106_14560 [Anaerolineae bacterium]
MDALGHVLHLQQVGELLAGIVVIGILGVADMLLLRVRKKRSTRPFWVGWPAAAMLIWVVAGSKVR